MYMHSSARNESFDLEPLVQKCFNDALAQKPENPIYKKGLEMTKRAPELYDEIQRQLAPPSMATRGAFWMDALGYVTVIGLIFGISYMVCSISS
jgi:Plant specific mitochondrial import receptor subunit TOM20